VAALKRYRPNVGVAPQEFVQRASVARVGRRAHVEEVRGLYRAKRDVLLPALEAAGFRHAGGDATFFLWLDAGEDAEARPRGCSSAGSSSRRVVLRRGRRAVPAARAGAHAGRVRRAVESARPRERMRRATDGRAAPR
jgi:aspartate/methionine/tyrosine aminotransferase